MEAQKMKNEQKTEKEIIQMIFEVFRKGLYGSSLTKEWFNERKLHLNVCGAGYSSGQWKKTILQHHMEMLIKVGYMKLRGKTDALGVEQYNVFGRKAIVFPLKNEQGEVVNIYGIKVETGKTIILNEEGLYPCHPSQKTRRLFVTQNVESAVVIIENGILGKDEAVLALFDGEIKIQHKTAVAKLEHLEEIILIEGAFAVKKIETELEN